MNQQDQSQVMAVLQCGVSGQNINYSVTGTSSQTGLASTSFTNGGLTSAGNSVNASYTYLDNQSSITIGNQANTLWGYWQNGYYPIVIRESYPVYLQERAMDKGKQAYEIIKALMDAKLLDVEKVKDFISAMDILLKTL